MDIWNKMCARKKLPVKVTDEKRSRRIGLTVCSLLDLKRKANDVLKITTTDGWKSLSVSLEDGTEVLDDSYLFSLQNTLLTVSREKPAVASHGRLFNYLYETV